MPALPLYSKLDRHYKKKSQANILDEQRYKNPKKYQQNNSTVHLKLYFMIKWNYFQACKNG